MLEGLQFGTIDAAIVMNALIATVEPGFQVVDMPFLFEDAGTAHAVLDGSIEQQLMASLEQNGIIGLGFAKGDFRHMINNVRPVSQPFDVEGAKFRVMQNSAFIDMFRSRGGKAVRSAGPRPSLPRNRERRWSGDSSRRDRLEQICRIPTCTDRHP